MKVAFIGNMNNNHFAMVRYLRDKGVDADLLLTSGEQSHFHPSTDTFDLEYMKFIKQLNWGDVPSFLTTKKSQIESDLSPYDILIGCGLAPAFCEKINRRLDVFIPYGDDIWSSTFYKFGNPLWMRKAWPTVAAQRRGLKKCKVWHMCHSAEMYENQYKKYQGNSERWYEGIPMVYAPIYDKTQLQYFLNKTHWAHVFTKIRENCEVMVLSHMRHHWSDMPDPNTKGNNILIRGWKQFCDQNKNTKSTLVLLEYGRDIIKSKKLIKELDIESSVVWLPKMFRKDIMVGLHLSDIVCGQFVNSWIGNGVLNEALTVGKPILTWRDDAYHKRDNQTLYPVLNANTPEDVASQLNRYLNDRDKNGTQIGKAGQEWYLTEVVKKSIHKYLEMIQKGY